MLSVFLIILKMSLSASIAALVVILARLCLRKAPKIFSYVLWLAVFLRLLCPFSISVPVRGLSDMPFSPIFESVFRPEETARPDGKDHYPEEETAPQLGGNMPSSDNTIGQTAAAHEDALNVEQKTAAKENRVIIPDFASYVWLAGTVLMLCYFARSYISVARKMRTAVRVSDNVFESDLISSAFVLGLVKPKIYIPTKLTGKQKQYIVLHEKTHIRRFDYLLKYIAFTALSIHWFNPMIWLSYTLMCADMEKSCDEAVIRKLSGNGQPVRRIIKQYSLTLLSLAERNGLAAPVSFADNSIKERMKNIMKFRKRSAFSMICLAVVCALLMTACMSSPVNTSAAKETVPVAASASDAVAVTSSEDVIDSRFPDLLAEYSTSFNAANQARLSNLALAGDYINGLVLEPGEVFSFNKVVGERTPERGFSKAEVYAFESTDEKYGGGVCQTASTLFYCAIKANLEIVSRTGHLYTVDYMTDDAGVTAYGMDAMVIWGKTDMQFRNSKENPIMIKCNTENGKITFSIWGTWDGYTAEYRFVEKETERYPTVYRRYEEGKKDQRGQIGRTMWAYRVVFYQADPNEWIPEEYERYKDIVTRYSPLPHIEYVEEPPAGYQFDTPYN